MNKSELAAAVAKKAGITQKDADKAVAAFTHVVVNEVANGGDVQIVGFGTFGTVSRAARQGRNPQTGEPIDIPATKVPKFKPGKGFKDAVAQK